MKVAVYVVVSKGCRIEMLKIYFSIPRADGLEVKPVSSFNVRHKITVQTLLLSFKNNYRFVKCASLEKQAISDLRFG